jgi:hypothetical protein
MASLAGNGPSKVNIININGEKVARKKFPEAERDRCFKEYHKMRDLDKISQLSSGIFSVPTVLGINNNGEFYDMLFIDNARELNDCGFIYSSSDLRDKLLAIIDKISSYKKSNGDLWKAMVNKFKSLKTDDKIYNDYIDHLPIKFDFNDNCYCYSHGDLTFDNILYSNGILYLIDPVWSEVESPLWDVGKILQSCLIRWHSICKHGKQIIEEGWLTYLCYSVSGHSSKSLADMFFDKYGIEACMIATACQLARVSRWCYADVLIPIINEILYVFLSNYSLNTKKDLFVMTTERMILK